MDFKDGRFEWQGDNADVNRAVFNALQNFMTEIAIDADVDLWILALKLGENIREQIEASGFVGAEDDRTLDDIAAIGDDLDGLVAQAKQAFGVVE